MAAKRAKILCYIDCVSPYSWFAHTNLTRTRPLLAAHGVDVEIVPFFLGGARNGAGNPFTVPAPAKATWGNNDAARVAHLLGLPLQRPTKFPILSLYPVRVLTFVHREFPEKFDASFAALEAAYWGGGGQDTSTKEGVAASLADVFEPAQMERVLAGAVTKENKDRTMEHTRAAQESGAFGAPWMVVTNRSSETATFFGNDRWDHIYAFLGLPYQPVTLLEKQDAKL